MVKCGVLFEVWTEFLNNIQTTFVFKGLIQVFQFIMNPGPMQCYGKFSAQQSIRILLFAAHFPITVWRHMLKKLPRHTAKSLSCNNENPLPSILFHFC
jgi:hypothetical protein